MDIRLNGKPRTVTDGATVRELVALLGLAARNVIVERNGEPVGRSRFADERLAPGDVVEVVRAVPGG